MRVVVTGGAGYIGYSIVGELLEEPSVTQIVVFDNLSRQQYSMFLAGRGRGVVRFVGGDILDGRTLGLALSGADAVIHLAARVHAPLCDTEAHQFDQVNNWGSAQVASAIENSSSVADVIYLSSTSVYGSGETSHTTRSTPHPTTFYGVTKLRGESHFKRLASSDRRVHIVRSGTVYGITPAARFDTVVNRLVLDARHRGIVRIDGSGAHVRSFVSVDRLARAVASLVTIAWPSSLINATDSTRSILSVAESLKALRPDLEFRFIDRDLRMGSLQVVPSPEIDTLTRTVGGTFESALGSMWTAIAI